MTGNVVQLFKDKAPDLPDIVRDIGALSADVFGICLAAEMEASISTDQIDDMIASVDELTGALDRLIDYTNRHRGVPYETG